MKDLQSHDTKWAAQKTSPAVKRFNAAVEELMRVQGLSREVAWAEVKRRNAKLFEEMSAVNELPGRSQLSADSQSLIPDWPATPAALGALGLPLSATREQYQIWKIAEKVTTIPPEMACEFVVRLTQFQQLTQGMKYDATFEALKRHFPDIFAALKEAGRA